MRWNPARTPRSLSRLAPLAAAALATPALAAPGGMGSSAEWPVSPATILVVVGALSCLGFFAALALLMLARPGGVPFGLKAALGGIGTGGLAIAALVFAATWPRAGYPEPAPPLDWVPEVRQARAERAASLQGYAGPSVEGTYAMPVDRGMQALLDDPSLLGGMEVDIKPWEEMTVEERGEAIYTGLVGGRIDSSVGYAACKTCHTTDGTRLIGPSFQGRWGQTAATMQGAVTFDEAYVTESIRNPLAKVAEGYPPAMPPMQLTDEQVAAIIAYLKTL